MAVTPEQIADSMFELVQEYQGRKKFKASTETPMQAVAENRAILQEAARKLIEAKAFEKDGSILIRQREL